jgi:hypothetical protein
MKTRPLTPEEHATLLTYKGQPDALEKAAAMGIWMEIVGVDPDGEVRYGLVMREQS